MKSTSLLASGIAAVAALSLTSSAQTTATGESLAMERPESESSLRWYFSPGVGFANFEGDQPLKDGG